jgi:hypothetical protein
MGLAAYITPNRAGQLPTPITQLVIEEVQKNKNLQTIVGHVLSHQTK